MIPDIIPLPYQVFYTVIPTISIIGNAAIIYVTVRSKSLRSNCNIFIALISFGEFFHSFSQYIMIISHNTSETHVIRQDICVYWQLLPLFGCFFSTLLLLNVAFDRLLSLKKIYITIDRNYRKLYMTAVILPSLLYASILVIWIHLNRTENEMVVCAITAPITGHIYIVFTKSILLINILILICYISFIFFIKKLRMSNKDAKHIYRSLIIVSVTVVFGGFSTMLFDFFTEFFHLNVERLYSNLLAGLFVNCAAATNFFVYYIMSKEYRRLFDEYLLIGYVKRNILKINDASSTIILSTLKTVH